MKISVVINTYNAEKHLETVLISVKDFDEIVICDMYSNDRTIEIAKKYNCKIIYHKNTGFVEPARMFAIQSACYDWVLVLDADEIVPHALKDFLYFHIKNKDCAEGVKIPRKNYFMGKWMRCVYPDHLIRFIRKNSTEWPPYIHAHPIIDGRIYTIPSNRKDLALIHLANESIQQNLNKTNCYTEFEIERRKQKQYNLFSILFEPGYRFIKFYFLKRAYKDGKAGFIYASLLSLYKYVTIIKIMASKKQYNDLRNDSKDYK